MSVNYELVCVAGILLSHLVRGASSYQYVLLMLDTVIPHRVSEDDMYEGYTIPGDSVIMPNLWCAYVSSFSFIRF